VRALKNKARTPRPTYLINSGLYNIDEWVRNANLTLGRTGFANPSATFLPGYIKATHFNQDKNTEFRPARSFRVKLIAYINGRVD